MFATAFKLGARFTPVTVTVNVRSEVPPFPSLARTVAAYGDPAASANPGAKLMFPDVEFVVETVINVGPATFENVNASPSGSDPVIT